MRTYADGWVEDTTTPLSSAYWLDGFPLIEDEQERALYGHGPDGRKSPIFDYRDDGIGAIQWMNEEQDRAAILIADGGWKTGGVFHLWISEGAGTQPRGVRWGNPPVLEKSDPEGWVAVRERAAAKVRQHLRLHAIVPEGKSARQRRVPPGRARATSRSAACSAT